MFGPPPLLFTCVLKPDNVTTLLLRPWCPVLLLYVFPSNAKMSTNEEPNLVVGRLVQPSVRECIQIALHLRFSHFSLASTPLVACLVFCYTTTACCGPFLVLFGLFCLFRHVFCHTCYWCSRALMHGIRRGVHPVPLPRSMSNRWSGNKYCTHTTHPKVRCVLPPIPLFCRSLVLWAPQTSIVVLLSTMHLWCRHYTLAGRTLDWLDATLWKNSPRRGSLGDQGSKSPFTFQPSTNIMCSNPTAVSTVQHLRSDPWRALDHEIWKLPHIPNTKVPGGRQNPM